jgi:hypothetical protein
MNVYNTKIIVFHFFLDMLYDMNFEGSEKLTQT